MTFSICIELISGYSESHALLTARRIFSTSKLWTVTPSRLRMVFVIGSKSGGTEDTEDIDDSIMDRSP